MSTREELEIAFEIITEGDRADIPPERKRGLGPNPERVMRALQERAEKWIGSKPVQGLAVGNRSEAGRRTDDLAIVVFVDRKRPLSKVRTRIPKTIDVPGVGRVETDVIAIGELRPEQYTAHVRPAMPGCSIGHTAMVTQGTFGLLVQKAGAQRGTTYILSNSHVLALDGLAALGDDIVQPGPGDIDGKSGTIAKLASFIPFNFTSSGFPNRIDAAIARVTGNVSDSIRVLDVAPVATSYQIVEGMHVRKVGRSSDLTDGTVLFPSAKIMLPHMKTASSVGTVRYRDQVVCSRYASPGDSGSAILNDQDQVIGLHAAGSFEVSTFNKIEHVFVLLGLALA